MRATRSPPKNTTRTSSSECTIAETRVRAPARTFTAVRAMAPVAGIPRRAGTPRSPTLPHQLRSGSWRGWSAIPSTTLADSKLSNAASAATARARPISSLTRAGLNDGSDGSGSEEGSAPMRVTSRPATSATTVAATTASSDAGRVRRSLVPRPSPSPAAPGPPWGASAVASPRARAATTAVFSLSAWRPRGRRNLLQEDDLRSRR